MLKYLSHIVTLDLIGLHQS